TDQLFIGTGTSMIQITGGGSGAVASVFGRTGIVAAQAGDYSTFYDTIGAAAAAQIAAEAYALSLGSDYDAAGAAATAQSNAESFATSAVATETSRAEAAEALLAPKAPAGSLQFNATGAFG